MTKLLSLNPEICKELLDFDNQSEEKTIELFKLLNQEIDFLEHTQWTNMFNSFFSNLIDYGNDASHLGPESHRRYADMIINYIEEYNDKRI